MEFDKIQERNAFNILYDFYGGLLSKKQQALFRMYYEENYSLAEIGQEWNMSRQGVHEALKRAEEKLHEYEETLQMVQRFSVMEFALAKAAEGLEDLTQHIGKIDETALRRALQEIRDEIRIADSGMELV